MKKNNNRPSLWLAFSATIVSFIFTIFASLDKSLLSFSNINWDENILLLLATSTTVIAVVFTIFSRSLKNKERKVLILYSHEDIEQVKLLHSNLFEYGIQVITDDDINIGDNIEIAIEKNIDQIDKIIYVISRNTNKSLWLEKKLNFALSKNKQIYPIMIEEAIIPSSLNGIKYAKLENINYESLYPLYKSIINS